MITVTIKDLTGYTFNLCIYKDIFVYSLKEIISKRTGYSISILRLVNNEKLLTDDKKINSYYKIENRSVIYFVLPLSGD